MIKVRQKITFICGIILLAVAFLFNIWLIQAVFVPDGSINSLVVKSVILAFQLAAALCGIFLLVRQPPVSKVQLVLFAASTAVSMLAIELGAGIWLKHLATPDQAHNYILYTDLEQWCYSRHHYLNYYPTPDYSYNDGLSFHNSLGYRGDEITPEKPEGVFRIACLGGSTTYETGVIDNRKTFTSQLEKALNRDYGYKVEVINAGVSGYTSWESLVNLAFRVLDLDPDLVLVYNAVNDVQTRFLEPDKYLSDNSGYRKQWSLPRVPVWEHSCILRIISRRLELTHQVELSYLVKNRGNELEDPMEGLKLNPPKFFRRNLKNMIAIARENGVKILLSTFAYTPYYKKHGCATAHFQKGIEEYNDVIRELAAGHEAPMFDFHSAMPVKKSYWSDGSHVNEKGAQLKAELFAEFIHNKGLITQ